MVSNKILISICVLLLNIGLAGAATLNVGQGQTYATIQSAINAASTGDVISVNEGTYSENLVVKVNGISIIGKNKEKTIIDGKKTGSVIRIDQANNVKVSGFTVQNSGGSGQYDGGINLYRANNNMVVNNIIINNVAGVSIYSGNNNIISGNDIKSNGKNGGIFVASSNDNRIYNNNIQNNEFGFYGDGARTNSIYSNNFIDNKNQAFDNSGMNAWDDGKSGNYWSPDKGILGNKNAKDNYPLSGAVRIKAEEVPAPAEQKTTQAEAGKATPGFAVIAVLVSLVACGILLRRRG